MHTSGDEGRGDYFNEQSDIWLFDKFCHGVIKYDIFKQHYSLRPDEYVTLVFISV